MNSRNQRRENLKIAHEFVEFLPAELAAGVLYVSMHYATASHKCFCGCGAEVVTPISRAGWQLYFDGEHVSLNPSVGSWSLPCQSHYWIRDGEIIWAPKWTRDEIKSGRAEDRRLQMKHFGESEEALGNEDSPSNKDSSMKSRRRRNWWSQLEE